MPDIRKQKCKRGKIQGAGYYKSASLYSESETRAFLDRETDNDHRNEPSWSETGIDASSSLSMEGLLRETRRKGQTEANLSGERNDFKPPSTPNPGTFDPSRSSFVAGTPVKTTNGYKPIEEIREGDSVFSRNPLTGEVSPNRVLNKYSHMASELYRIHYADGTILEATGNHRIFVNQTETVAVKELHNGDRSLTNKEEEDLQITKLGRITLQKPITVYNFEVENDHTYFVTKRDVWVHNQTVETPSMVDVAPALLLIAKILYRRYLDDAVLEFFYPRIRNYSARERDEYFSARAVVNARAEEIREAGLICHLSFGLQCERLERIYVSIPEKISDAERQGYLDAIEKHRDTYPALLTVTEILLTEGAAGGGPTINPRMQPALAGGGTAEIAITAPLSVPVPVGGLISEARGKEKEEKLKGGKRGKRDRTFGIKDEKFWKWWHRVGKKERGGLDLASTDEAESIYQEWIQSGRPEPK